MTENSDDTHLGIATSNVLPANRDEEFTSASSGDSIEFLRVARAYSAGDASAVVKLSEGTGIDQMVDYPLSYIRHERHAEPVGSPLIRSFSQSDWWQIAACDIDFGEQDVVLGSGSISIVLKAELDGEDVAVKVLRTDEEEAERDAGGLPVYGLDLKDELGAFTTGIKHPNIVEFKGAGSVLRWGAVVPMIVFEYLPTSFADMLEQKTEMNGGNVWTPPLDLAMSWCQQLFAALNYLHNFDTPIAHRDLKPANLLVSEDSQTLKLADFSLASPIRRNRICEEDCTIIPSLAGSFRYMAPEVAQRIPFELAPADIFSATITAWSLVNGRRPYDTIRDAKSALSCVVGGLRPVVKDNGLKKVFEAGWHNEPRRRCTAGEMEQLFAAFLQKERKQSWGKKIFKRVKSSFSSSKPSRVPSSSAPSSGGFPLLQRLASA